MDPLQDTAQLISDAGGSSGKIYLRKGQKPCPAVRSEENCEKQSCNKQGQRKKWKEVPEQGFLTGHREDHGDIGCSPDSPWRTRVEEISTLQPTEDPTSEQADVT